MRLITVLCLLIAGTELVSACCDPKGPFTCCGNGQCNVFCCNCDNGCDTKCKAWRGPIRVPGGRKPGKPPVSLNIQIDTVDHLTKLSRLQGDQKTLDLVDVEGKGYFTFEQFIEFVGFDGEEESEAWVGWKSKFELFDRNGDGMIDLHEMRLPGEIQDESFAPYESSEQATLTRDDLK